MFKKLFIFISLLALIVTVSLAVATHFLKPILEEKFLGIAESSLGKRIELSAFDISLLKGIIFLKGFKVEDPEIIKYYSSVTADEIILDLDLPLIALQRNLIFQEIHAKNLIFHLRNKKRGLSSISTSPSQETSSDSVAPAKTALNSDSLYIKKLSMENWKFIFEDYSVGPSPVVMELVDINGTFKDLLVPLNNKGLLKAEVHVNGQFDSTHNASVNIDGSFAKSGDLLDFNLLLRLDNLNLTKFSPYYSQTPFTTLKEAKIDLYSKASCRKNQLNARQNVRVYDIKLNDIEPMDKDKLFGLSAKTVIDFFKDLKGEVEFDFNLVGTINDPRFDLGPIVEKILTRALEDKIMATLRELPREVVKMSEKAIKESLEGKGDLEEKLRKAKKKLKEIISY